MSSAYSSTRSRSFHVGGTIGTTNGLIDTLLAWRRGTPATPGLDELDEEDDPVEYAGFDAWDDDSYW
jgi:hypothetical protein